MKLEAAKTARVDPPLGKILEKSRYCQELQDGKVTSYQDSHVFNKNFTKMPNMAKKNLTNKSNMTRKKLQRTAWYREKVESENH